MGLVSSPRDKVEYHEEQTEEQVRKAQLEVDPDMKRRRYDAAQEHAKSAQGYRETIQDAYDET